MAGNLESGQSMNFPEESQLTADQLGRRQFNRFLVANVLAGAGGLDLFVYQPEMDKKRYRQAQTEVQAEGINPTDPNYQTEADKRYEKKNGKIFPTLRKVRGGGLMALGAVVFATMLSEDNKLLELRKREQNQQPPPQK